MATFSADPYCCRTPPVARRDDARAYVGSRSTTTTSARGRRRRSSNAMLDPITPPPTTTTTADSCIVALREPALEKIAARRPVVAMRQRLQSLLSEHPG